MKHDFMWGISLCEVPEEYKDGDVVRIKEMGIEWVRLHFSWRHIEKEKGVFDFSFYDPLIDKLLEQNIKILAAVGCGYTHMLPDWIVNEHQDCLNLFEYIPQISRFARETVDHFKGRVEIWQPENEINQTSFHVFPDWRMKSWMLNPMGEVSILVGIVSMIKACDPASKIVINLECDNPNWYPLFKFYLKKKLPFDFIGIDFYPCYSPTFSSSDPIFSCPDRILNLIEIIRQASKLKKEIILVESGYSAPNGAYSLENQASYVHQVCQVALATGIQGAFIWALADSYSKEPAFPEHYFGIYTNDREMKPAASTYKDEINRINQTIIISIKGLLFRETKACIEVYINGELAGKTNIDGMFISKDLSPGKYKLMVKGFFPWQKRSREIELRQGEAQYFQIVI